MYKDEGHALWAGGKAGRYRVAPAGTSLNPAGNRSNNHDICGTAIDECVSRPSPEWLVAQDQIMFVAAEPLAFAGGYDYAKEAHGSILANMSRPTEVRRLLATSTVTIWPTIEEPPSTTTMVPSSRYPTP